MIGNYQILIDQIVQISDNSNITISHGLNSLLKERTETAWWA